MYFVHNFCAKLNVNLKRIFWIFPFVYRFSYQIASSVLTQTNGEKPEKTNWFRHMAIPVFCFKFFSGYMHKNSTITTNGWWKLIKSFSSCVCVFLSIQFVLIFEFLVFKKKRKTLRAQKIIYMRRCRIRLGTSS